MNFESSAEKKSMSETGIETVPRKIQTSTRIANLLPRTPNRIGLKINLKILCMHVNNQLNSILMWVT